MTRGISLDSLEFWRTPEHTIMIDSPNVRIELSLDEARELLVIVGELVEDASSALEFQDSEERIRSGPQTN